MNSLLNFPFICARCHQALVGDAHRLHCSADGYTLSLKDGVAVDEQVAAEQDKAFYDAFYQTDHGADWYQGLNRQSPLKRLLEQISLSYRRERFFRNNLTGTGNTILDLASGAGRDYFATYGTVVGVDVSYDPLRVAKDRYGVALQSGVTHLPFADDSFDYVVTSDFFGHVRAEDKDAIIAEIHRVLKPGGKTLHIIETDSTNPLFRIAHTDPALFQKYFIEKIGGHIGLEVPSSVVTRWKKANFDVVRAEKIWSVVWPVQYYADLFGPEYEARFVSIKIINTISRWLGKIKIIQVGINIVLTPINLLVEWLTPLDFGVGLMLVCQKKK